ncbi:nucleoside permease [Bacillus hominis]|uniref:Nucleoside permease n=1 Tax=Bacillus mycoides TaxID=1405 RepID=A0A1S9T724_BACMY|nr:MULTISPECIES: nucleoside permease [Bacillus cereus group]MDM5195485.1 nucleoside permease [Bacillus hominis]OOR05788.1 nucleoside permease [Bacillus mycoides]
MALNRWLTDEEYARASANGISRGALKYRVYEAEWDLEEALTAPPKSVRHNKFEGLHMEWRKVATENGINSATYYSRLEYGWGYQEAATKPVKKSKGLGKLWLALAKPNGIGYNTFMSRVITRKWDVEKAATKPVEARGRKPAQAKEAVL